MDVRRHVVWRDAFADEIAEVNRRRGEEDVVERGLVGLALSGGGIRSATFGLGVLDSLRRCGVLLRLDYLSTVSGGGYVGAWLSANCERNPGWLEPAADWTASVAHLRRYSNYLSPDVGFFSADTWSMGTVWLRNTLLIQMTVILAIACVLLLPRPLFELFGHWPHVGSLRWASILLFLLGIVGIAGNQMRLTSHGVGLLLRVQGWRVGLAVGLACLGAAWTYARLTGFAPFASGMVPYRHAFPIAVLLVVAGFVLQPVGVRLMAAVWPGDDPPEQINYTQNWVQAAVVVPLMSAAFLVAAILWGEAIGAEGVEGLSGLDSYGAF